MERRFSPTAIAGTPEVRETKDGPRIIGYGSVFWNGRRATQYELAPGVVERIMPGAFDRAIRDHHDVRGLFNHDPSLVLGRTISGTMTLSADKRGLKYSITPPNTTLGRDTVEVIRRGDVSGSSFAFKVITERWLHDRTAKLEIREITDVQLFDVSPVTFPAYEGATTGLAGERQEEIEAELATYHARCVVAGLAP